MPGPDMTLLVTFPSGGAATGHFALDAAVAAVHAEQIQLQTAVKQAARRNKYPLLEDITPVKPKRRVNMPMFRLSFDNLPDIKRRLGHSLIYIGGDLYYISEIYEEDGQFMLYVFDKFGDTYRCPFNHPALNLRTPEPRYIQYNQQPHYFYRPPVREQQQGLGQSNAYVKPVFGAARQAEGVILVKALNKHDNVQWSSLFAKMMLEDELFESLRLSNTVAFATKIGKKRPVLRAEYKGRKLGSVKDDTIFMGELDYDKHWIRRDVEMIGCKARVGE